MTFCISYDESYYVEIFAPYVKVLEIDFDFKPCEFLLGIVIEQCNALNSLTVSHGGCSSTVLSKFCMDELRSLPEPINTSLRTVVLRDCSLQPEFLSSLAYACHNQRQLTIDCTTGMVFDSINLPEAKLEQLDLDLCCLFNKSHQHKSLALITVVDSYKTW